MVHIIKPDSFYWQNLADRVEHAILYDLDGAQNEEELRSSLGKFLDFTTLLASELQVLETRDGKVNKLKKSKNEEKTATALTMEKFKKPKPSSITQMEVGEKVLKLAEKRIKKEKATKQRKKDNEKIRQQNNEDLGREFNDIDMNMEAGSEKCEEESEVGVFNNMKPGKRVPWPEK